MTLADLTDRNAVIQAVVECNGLGRDRFLAKYGFGRAYNYFLDIDGRRYDSKAIVGVAHRYQFPGLGPLGAHDFSGGLATVKRKLDELGFNVLVLSDAAHIGSYWWQDRQDERFWVEIRRSAEGLGTELRCPLADEAGGTNALVRLAGRAERRRCDLSLVVRRLNRRQRGDPAGFFGRFARERMLSMSPASLAVGSDVAGRTRHWSMVSRNGCSPAD
jgi:hypothetical protein